VLFRSRGGGQSPNISEAKYLQCGPETRTTPMPPAPLAVAIAAMVSEILLTLATAL
jgi:hypothetical protein